MLAAKSIPRDDRLPHLATVASESAMGALFANTMEPGWTLRRCRIKEARYYPGQSCLVAYTLKCANPSGEAVNLSIFGRAFGAEAVPEAFRNRAPLVTPMGRIPSYVPQLALALWTFPDDPGIFGLASIWRRGGTLFDAPDVLVHTPWQGRRPGLETVLVSYVPTKRCILRYDRVDHAQPESFYGKVYAAEDARVLFGQMQELWDYAARQAPELHLARPLGCDAGLNAVWQSSPGGDSLLEVLDQQDVPQVMRRVAAALAAVHRAPLELARTLKLEDETQKLERARSALLRFYPSLAPAIEATLLPLLESAPDEIERPVPVHGDFHCNQVLVRDDRVALIDFDLLGLGDPLHDVGRFLSRFRAYAAGRLHADQILQAERAFLSAYEILVPWRVDRARLAWIEAALLVNRQALKPVKKLAASGSDPVAEMLAMAARIAAGQERP